MRDYSVVTPAFWIGTTGKQLRGNIEAQLLAVYLMTSPHSTMTGVFHCPILYMAHETGLSFEGASKALASLCEAGFCEYEAASETVFVYRMASFQIGPSLKPGDNRIKGIEKDVEKMASPSQKAKFLKLYSEAFSLSPLEAPTKPRTGTRTRTGTSTPTELADESFETFWIAYPKKEAKPTALKAFKAAKINGHLPEVLKDIESRLDGDDWKKNKGQFIPMPATYLNQRRWEDVGIQPKNELGTFL